MDITKQRRIDSLLNADHNTDAEKEYLRKRILEIFQDSEEGKKVLGELDKEDEEEEKNKERQRKKGGNFTNILRAVVNFINVKFTNFLYEHTFWQLLLRTCN